MIRNCKSGTIILRRLNVTIDSLLEESDDMKIDVLCNGYHITSLRRLNIYLFKEEDRSDPDLDIPGIELYSIEDK